MGYVRRLVVSVSDLRRYYQISLVVSALQYFGTEGNFSLAKIVSFALNHQYEDLHEQLSTTSDFCSERSISIDFTLFANLQVFDGFQINLQHKQLVF